MTVYIFSPIWGQTWKGVGETYITNDCNAATARNYFQSVSGGRMSLLPNTAYCFGWRWGVYGGKHKSVVLRPPFAQFPPDGMTIPVPSNGSQPVTPSSGWPPYMGLSLQVNQQFGAGNDRFSRKYLAGIPTNILAGEPATLNLAGNTGWAKLMQNFETYLVNNFFQIQAQNLEDFPILKIAGLTVQSAAPGLVGLIVNTASPPTITSGTRLKVQHLLPAKNTRNATMNGQWTVDSTNYNSTAQQYTIYLRGSAGIDPTAQRVGSKSICFVAATKLYPILEYSPVTVVARKRGKVSGASRGRRLSRPSLDP